MKEGKLFNCRRVICAWSVFFFVSFTIWLSHSVAGKNALTRDRRWVVKIIKTTVTLDAYFIKRKLKQSVPRSAGGAHAAY